MKKFLSVLCAAGILLCGTTSPSYSFEKKDIIKAGTNLGTVSAVTLPVLFTAILTGKYIVNNYLFWGTHKQRAYDAKYLKKSTTIAVGENDNIVKVSRDYIEIGDLKGAKYKAKDPSNNKLSNKCVIFCGPNSRSVHNFMDNMGICKLLDAGATVVAVDYRGYGYSELSLAHFRISQSTIYKDSEKIYEYVRHKLNYSPNDIIEFGYSLGGSTASHAAVYAQSKGENLGGLILATPIKNLKHAAQAQTNFIGAALARILTLSPLDTEKNLSLINNKSLPIFLCSGNKEKDFLSIENTMLHEKVKESGFKNISHNIAECTHHNVSKMFECESYDDYIKNLT